MRLRTAIGTTIKALRTERKLTARAMTPYVSLGHISEIERGMKSASAEVLEAIATGLGLTAWQLLLEIAHTMAVEDGTIQIPDTAEELFDQYSDLVAR